MKTPRWRLFPKYASLIIALVAGVLIASGAVSIFFSWREIQTHLVALQAEKALGAATRIEQYVQGIEHEMSWTAFPRMDATGDAVEQRRIEYLKLLRQVPAITELVWIGPDGRERLRVSRLAMDAASAGTDLSQEPAFITAKGGKTWFGPVQFRKGTEPYMALARPAGGGGGAEGGGVTVADVNLKFVWDVVSRIKIGVAGLAYVVDATGTLIAHPDISLVLKKTDLSALPQVAALLKPGAASPAVARDLAGQEVLAANARIPALDWTVFVESPRAEAFAPLYASILRLALLLVAGLAVAALASFFLARALVRPIRALQEGAAQIGAGELEQRIEVKTGDELEALAEQFNQMGSALKASYAGLERKVDERTAQLQFSLDQQTAIAEVLRVMSASVADSSRAFAAIVSGAEGLFGGSQVGILLIGEDQRLHLAAHSSAMDDTLRGSFPTPMAGTATERAIREQTVLHLPDVLADPDYAPALRDAILRTGRSYSIALAPMLWQGRGIGSVFITHTPPQAFTHPQLKLLSTFADQAVIAIQNSRLFNETKEALEQQTATAEVLQIISSSLADTQPVFDKILDSCAHLFDAGLMMFNLVGDDGRLHLAAIKVRSWSTGGESLSPAEMDRIVASLRRRYPLPLADSGTEAAMREGRVLNFPDVLYGADVPPSTRRGAERDGINFSQVYAPLMLGDRGIGTITLVRHALGGFTDKEQALLKTFADQAVIAIQNARLFNEIQAKSRELEQANKHKSEFLANMSHELRTPLNAIIGFSEVLTEEMFGAVNDKQMEYLKDIHSSGQHLLTLINDVLDLSKIEAGRMELELSCFDLGLLLDHSMTLVRERAARHGLKLALEVDSQLSEVVADARKVKQVVVNLLSNAVKFTPTGGSVTVRARALDATDGMAAGTVEVSVIDTGVGIAPAEQALVFEEFRQASGDYLRKAEGTGLGLALARRFVELHGGTVRLQRAPGRGSTFSFTLPPHTLEALQE